MARYIGPTTKIARRFGEPIFGPDKSFQRRTSANGRNKPNRRRRRTSEYGLQLMEKQKAKFIYGLLERQFANLFDNASRRKGVTGEILLQLLESRLDNVVFRLGIAPTRAAARQLVSHCHITVNGAVANVPSYLLKPSDIVAVRDRSKSLEVIDESLQRSRIGRYSWLEWDAASKSGKFLNYPDRADIPENIKEQLIVELYSK